MTIITFNMAIPVMESQVWEFKVFLPKDQHTKIKLLNYENWCNGEASKSAKI